MKITTAFYIVLSLSSLIFISIYFVMPIYAQGQPEPVDLGDQLSSFFGLSKDEFFEYLAMGLTAITILICFKFRKTGNKSQSDDKK